MRPAISSPASISATFYSDLRTIFVTTLLAVGLALVAVKGRPGGENTLLDVAGVTDRAQLEVALSEAQRRYAMALLDLQSKFAG